MDEDTDVVQPTPRSPRPLDAFDRKILALLVKNVRLTHAAIGQEVGLSPPAVHDRIKRMRETGTISASSALLDARAIGKPLLAFVHVDADGWGKSQRMMRLSAFPEVEEMHSVAGDTCIILKVRTADTNALEHFLSQLYILPGVRGTKTFVALSTYLERPVQAEVTQHWPTVPLPPG